MIKGSQLILIFCSDGVPTGLFCLLEFVECKKNNRQREMEKECPCENEYQKRASVVDSFEMGAAYARVRL